MTAFRLTSINWIQYKIEIILILILVATAMVVYQFYKRKGLRFTAD